MEKETSLFIKAYRIELPNQSDYDTPTEYTAQLLDMLKIRPYEIDNSTFKDHIIIQIQEHHPKAAYAKDILETMLPGMRVTIYYLQSIFA